MVNKQIIKDYWNYYLELESRFEQSRRYISFDSANYAIYSVEYIQLLQAICSGIDVVGKVIAQYNNKNFVVDNKTNIVKWGFEVQKCFKDIDLWTIYFDNAIELRPFSRWKYKEGTAKNPIVLFDNTCSTPKWWLDYNKVKHARTSVDEKEQIQNYKLANLKNVIYALGALYILEMILLQKFAGVDLDSCKIYSVKESSLYTWSMEDMKRKNTIIDK